MMLDEQISKVLDEIVHISEMITRIKEIADRKDHDILELSNKISDAMHRLEMTDDLSNEEAARLGKEIATTRKERRECKNFVEQVQPLLMFYAAHGPAMDALKNACASIAKKKECAGNAIFFSRSTGEATDVVSGESVPVTNGWKPPRPVLCTTKGGITIHFSSVGAAARAFNYSKKQIFDCCYGTRDDIDGDRFEFITGDKTTPTAPFSALRGKLEAELAARNAPKEPEPEPQPEPKPEPKPEPEITDVYPESDGDPEKERSRWAIGVRVTTPDGKCTEYRSICRAAAELGFSAETVKKRLLDGNTHRGCRFEFLDNDMTANVSPSPDAKKAWTGVAVPVRVTFKNGESVEYESVTEAGKAIGISIGSLSYALKHSGICKGYKIERI